VHIGGGELHRQRQTLPIDQHVLLAALLAAVGFGPVCSPPRLARTLLLSTLARLQSMASKSPNQLRTTW
jgi:hypothetical protein